MEIAEQIKRFTEFFEETYKAALLEDVRKGNRFFVADFSDYSGMVIIQRETTQTTSTKT